MKKVVLIFYIMLCFIGARSTAFAQTKEVQMEGVLRMYVIDNEGNQKAVSQYRKTDGNNTSLAFVVETNKRINVTPYLDREEIELFFGNQEVYGSSFMVVPQFKYSGKDFAAKYANKRVRVKGTLYIPGTGWRNATAIVMSLNNIQPINASKLQQKEIATQRMVFYGWGKGTVVDGRRSSTGHAFVYVPKIGCIGYGPVHGKWIDDDGTIFNHQRLVKYAQDSCAIYITNTQLKNVYNKVKALKKNTPRYYLGRYDCTSFVMDIADAAGIHYGKRILIQTPIGFMKEMKKYNGNSYHGHSKGIPKSLVGTKWVTSKLHNNWTGQKRTLEFISSTKVRITDEVLFYQIATSDELPPPENHTYDCYYDSGEAKIIVKKKSDQMINSKYIRLQYNGSNLKETTNSTAEVEYEKIN